MDLDLNNLRSLNISDLKKIQREVKREMDRRINAVVQSNIKNLYVGAVCKVDDRVLRRSNLMNYSEKLFKVTKINKKNIQIEEIGNPSNVWSVIGSALNIVR